MSTMAERAAAYALTIEPREDDVHATIKHLAQFAAAEVARVREMQMEQLRALDGVCVGFGRCGPSGPRCKVCLSADAIDAATRPERPGRAKAKRLIVNPDPPVVIPPRTKRIRGLSFKATDFLDPPDGLSSLARTVKKRGAR